LEPTITIINLGRRRADLAIARPKQPVVDIRPIAPKLKKPCPIGLDEGRIKLGPKFLSRFPTSC
jgi:hypothetical protein